jgi:hypothetical protein
MIEELDKKVKNLNLPLNEESWGLIYSHYGNMCTKFGLTYDEASKLREKLYHSSYAYGGFITIYVPNWESDKTQF